MKYAVIHYDEIALKKGNREYFEMLLLHNIQDIIGKRTDKIKKELGYLIITFKKDVEDSDVVTLSRIPGVTNICVAVEADNNIDHINKVALSMLDGTEKTFGIDTKRRNKDFKLDSMQINREVGSFIVEKASLKVNLDKPDIRITIEVCNKNSYLSKHKVEGVGGMPTGSVPKTVCLISGGIDSPVAGFMISKRGSKVVYVHFQNKLVNNSAVQTKIEDLVKILATYQNGAKLYIVPFEEIQKKIISSVPSKLRMIIYKRVMIKMASMFCRKEKAKALIVGDSVAQVASQTLENMESIYFDAPNLMLYPLVGMNKNETITIARKIGTYETSIKPYGDCCSYFIAEHPETKSNPSMIKSVEAEFDIEADILEAFKNSKLLKF